MFNIKEYKKEYKKEYYKNNIDKIKEYYIKNKKKIYEKQKEIRKKNRVKINKKQRELNKIIRLKVLTHYSNGKPKCACCGEDIYEFLAIDHINNDGSYHRGIIKSNIDVWLKRNNFPPGFQVLCHNCNCAKGFYGECPHKKKLSTP